MQFPWSSSARGDDERVYSEAFDVSPAAALDGVRDELVPCTQLLCGLCRALVRLLIRRHPHFCHMTSASTSAGGARAAIVIVLEVCTW